MRVGFLLGFCLSIAACSSAPKYTLPKGIETTERALIHYQSDDTLFPCHSARVLAVDGTMLSGSDRSPVPISRGEHRVEILGKSGYRNTIGLIFGPHYAEGCIYNCAANLSFIAEPGHAYQLYHKKEAEPNEIHLIDKDTKKLVARSTCRLFGSSEELPVSD